MLQNCVLLSVSLHIINLKKLILFIKVWFCLNKLSKIFYTYKKIFKINKIFYIINKIKWNLLVLNNSRY